MSNRAYITDLPGRPTIYLNDLQENRDVIWMWVVYKSPRDSPGNYVVRRHGQYLGSSIIAQYPEYTGPDLQSARAVIPRWLTRLERCENDDPVILETWL